MAVAVHMMNLECDSSLDQAQLHNFPKRLLCLWQVEIATAKTQKFLRDWRGIERISVNDWITLDLRGSRRRVFASYLGDSGISSA